MLPFFTYIAEDKVSFEFMIGLLVIIFDIICSYDSIFMRGVFWDYLIALIWLMEWGDLFFHFFGLLWIKLVFQSLPFLFIKLLTLDMLIFKMQMPSMYGAISFTTFTHKIIGFSFVNSFLFDYFRFRFRFLL